MKKILTFLLLALTLLLSAASISLDSSSKTGFRVTSSGQSGFSLEIDIDEIFYSVSETAEGNFIRINFTGSQFTHETGYPQLPVFRELIGFPVGSDPTVEIVSYKETEILLSDYMINSKIIPSQPSWSKSTPADDIKFIIDKNAYSAESYSKSGFCSISKSGTMRGVDVGVLEIRPVAYNPVNNSIKIMTGITAEVKFGNVITDLETDRNDNFSPFFESAFSKLINISSADSKDDLLQYPVTYLVVANEILSGNAKLQEFINWKTQKGFNVITNFFPSTATTSTVDAWVEEQYNTLIPKPSFLLIIGDQSGSYVIPSEQYPALGSAGNVSVSDLMYGVIGATSVSNRIPSIHVGRFSVNNLTELDAQIDKTLWYEKNQFDTELNPGQDFTYLSRVMGVAGVDGTYGSVYGNPQIRYGMEWYFNTNYRIPLDGSKVNITGIPYYYPASAGSTVDAAVVAEVSSGVAFYNYTAHGYNGGFADPTFTITNVNNLTNTGKYPLIVGNCCLTGSFRDTECFGESWLNVADKGAIGFIGASMSTYWDEDLAMGIGEVVTGDVTPPYTPDSYGMYDGSMRMRYATQGGIRFSGLMAVEQLNSSMTSSYWSSYHLFGDPSLMVYMGIPGDNTVVHDSEMPFGVDHFTVQALAGSYVAITDDEGILHGAAVADESGYANVSLDYFIDGNANIVVTSQFKKPYFSTIPVGDATGPWLVNNFNEFSTLNFGESGTINIGIKNIGIAASEGVTVSVSSLDENITFIGGIYESFGTIAEQDSLSKNSIFPYMISPSVYDGQPIDIIFSLSDTSKKTYEENITIYCKAPVLNHQNSFEGEINPGDTKDITLSIQNTGNAVLSDINAALSETTGKNVTISGSQNISSIGINNTEQLIFNVGFGADIANGTTLNFKLDLTAANGYTDTYEFNTTIGITETFESGDFTNNPWYFEGNADWQIDNSIYYSGSFSSRSGTILNNQISTMKIDFEFTDNGTFSFYRKVSSESNYDKLHFYIDDILKNSWSGELDWSNISYPVTTGTHTFTWTYEKDYSDSYGYDCAWIDNILATNAFSGIETDTNILPDKITLNQNYPNPFNPVTTINFSIPFVQNVLLNIYNSNGQLVRSILDKNLDRGAYSITIDASPFNSGIYFYTLETASEKITRKMLLIK